MSEIQKEKLKSFQKHVRFGNAKYHLRLKMRDITERKSKIMESLNVRGESSVAGIRDDTSLHNKTIRNLLSQMLKTGDVNKRKVPYKYPSQKFKILWSVSV